MCVLHLTFVIKSHIWFRDKAARGIGGPGGLSRYSDLLPAAQFGVRSPVRARFSTPVQTGPGAPPGSHIMVFIPGVKRSGRGLNHPFQSRTEDKERVELYLYPPVVLRGLL